MPAIPVLRRWKQEDSGLKISLGYIVRVYFNICPPHTTLMPGPKLCPGWTSGSLATLVILSLLQGQNHSTLEPKLLEG